MLSKHSPAIHCLTKTRKTLFTHNAMCLLFFVDDSYLQSKTYEQSLQIITGSIIILQELGFGIHLENRIT